MLMSTHARPRLAQLLASAFAILLAATLIQLPQGAAFAVSSQTALSLPFLGSTQTQLPDRWTVHSCTSPGSIPDDVLTIECDETMLNASSHRYDPDIPVATVSLEMTAGSQHLTLLYDIVFEPPVEPSAHELNYNFPFAKGSTVTIPHAELGIDCEGCRLGGATYAAEDVEPASAGTLEFSSTHLIFRASPDFVGSALLTYTATDAYGTTSEPLELTITLRDSDQQAPLVPAQLLRLDDADYLEGNVLTEAVDPGGAALTLVSCGSAFHGKVVCASGGSFTYVPPRGFTGIDQFAAHVFSDSGEQVVSTVQIGVHADAPAVEKTSKSTMKSLFLSPSPERDDSENTNGMFGSLRKVLDTNAPR